MSIEANVLRSCSHYEPNPINRWCLNCGGSERLGPSCWCPEFGECEDCIDAAPDLCDRHEVSP